jgi:hypothetical protein
MVGLEKTKAKSGEVSQSARALTLEDMHRLHDKCTSSNGKSVMEQRWGAIRYVRMGALSTCLSPFILEHSQAAYLLAWLMFLRVDEVVNLEFESVEIIPGERALIPAE